MIKDNVTFAICDFETTGVYPDIDYPIEIGLIFTDNNFVIKHTYSSLICFDKLRTDIIKNKNMWLPEHEAAYNIHKIPASEVVANGLDPEVLVSIIKDTCLKIKVGKTPVTLLSDNSHFEYDFMRKLFGKEQDMQEYFHYTAWDSNILTDISGIGDPIPVHRALPDCALLHQAIIRSVEKIGGFKPNKR